MKYNDIPTVLRGLVCNGVGQKGGIINPPDLAFGAAGDRHDWDYWIGGTEQDRKVADDRFLSNMLRAAKFDAVDAKEAVFLGDWGQAGRYLMARWVYPQIARLYAWAVRRWGGTEFNYGSPRTLDDLKAKAAVEINRLRTEATRIEDALLDSRTTLSS